MAMDEPIPMASADGESERDYAALLATLSATARGRAFLDEFARRNRMADTDRLLAAIARLEAMIAAQQHPAPAPPPQADAPPPAPEVAAAEKPAPVMADQTAPDVAGEPAAVNMPEIMWFTEPPAEPDTPPAAAPAPVKPPAESAPPQPPLTQIMALSEEERLALFS